jgi:Undecaprenyl-phosphate glucose phosphotransferase
MTAQPPHAFDEALDTAVRGDPRDRRGPFRPERLVSSRERKSGGMSLRLFRAADTLVMIIFSLACAAPLARHGWLAAPMGDLLPFAVAATAACALLKTCGLYRFGRDESRLLHLAGAAAVMAAAALAGAGLSAFAPDRGAVTAGLVDWALTAAAAFLCLHGLWLYLIGRWRRQGKLTPNVVVVGATKNAHYLIDGARNRGDVNVLGVFDDRLARSPASVAGVPVLGDVRSLLGHKITPYVDQIVIAIDTSAKARLKTLVEQLRVLPNEVHLLVDVDSETGRNTALSRMADQPLARVSGVDEDERRAMAKRIQDLVLGTLMLLAFSPVMLLTAIAIKLDSPGPVFFRQRRHGFNNEAIRVWKFRSMYTHMTDHTSAQQVQKADPRVTRVGRFIRKTSLDELPQLFNVLTGEMSLVGPRPHAIGMKTGSEESARLVAEYAWRHRMKPGVTGWAAIKGSRGALDTAEDVRRRVALDIEYIERQSFWFDLYIMLMTGPCLLGDSAATR